MLYKTREASVPYLDNNIFPTNTNVLVLKASNEMQIYYLLLSTISYFRSPTF